MQRTAAFRQSPRQVPAVLAKPQRSSRRLLAPLLLLSGLLCTNTVLAEDDGWFSFDNTYLQLGYGAHWDDSDDYRGIPALIGLEWSKNDRRIAGVSLFNNSFGQFSQYYYYGYKWRLNRWNEKLQVKLSGGFIYGYVGEFEDRLDPNWSGFSPAIIPSLGWKERRWGFDVAVLGTAGVMFLVGRDLGD